MISQSQTSTDLSMRHWLGLAALLLLPPLDQDTGSNLANKKFRSRIQARRSGGHKRRAYMRRSNQEIR